LFFFARERLRLGAHLVGKCRLRLVEVEFAENDWNEKKSHAEHHRQPERRRRHQRGGCPNERVDEQFRVEDEHEHEVEDDAAPDDEVIEAGPVRRLQSALRRDRPHTMQRDTQI